MTLFPFKRGKCLVWDATVTDTYAASNIFESPIRVGSAALKAEENKRAKYSQLSTTYLFEPLAFETSGVCGKSTNSVINELGSRLCDASGDPREASWLRQRISVALLRALQGQRHLHSRVSRTVLGGRTRLGLYVSVLC